MTVTTRGSSETADVDAPVWLRRPSTAVERLDDAAARLALAARGHPRTNRAMYALSMLGDDGRVWIAAAAVEAIRSRRPVHTFSRAMGWLIAESVTVNLVIKRVVRRGRPAVVTEHEHRLRIPSDTSFPSGHASSAATMAVILSEDSPLAPLWFALAVGIGASRVHVGVHHASDVLGGWTVGVAFGLLARRYRSFPTAERTWSRIVSSQSSASRKPCSVSARAAGPVASALG